MNTAFAAPLPAEKSGERFPQQDLWRFDQASRRKVRPDVNGVFRRIFVFAGMVLLTAYLTSELIHVLSVGGFAALEIVLIGLFVLNIAWLSLSFMTALSGFLVVLFGIKPSIVSMVSEEEAKHLPEGRTAILVCTYNEAPERIFGMALATMKELETSGHGESFDVFIVSDTTDPDIWVHEEAAFKAARARPGNGPRLYYRRRAANTGKKAGNIADWCRRWGPAYDYMIVLDADSLMTGASIVQLAHIMDKKPEAGLIQTVPVTIGRNTLFARMQQFAGGLYGPIMASGLAFWHRGTGNFWGHNAIIRVRAFMESAGLPHLPGSPPFGGQILSHDFVEAALMCRQGWRVCMAPEIKGSYEEIPPSLIDFATRDRRWCQGNLQHSRIIGAKGLRPMSRVHLGMGIMAYLSALIWLLFLITALLLTIQQLTAKPIYFGGDQTLFPTWPMQDSERAMSLLFWTLALLLLPKLFGLVLALFSGEKRRGFGGIWGLGSSVVMETVLSSLFAHVMMMVQSAAIFDILRGRDSGWNPQRRDDGSLPMSWVVRYHLLHMTIGTALGIFTFMASLPLFLWLLPATLGLALSGPLSAASATRKWGERFKYLGIFAIAEERRPPAILLSARKHSEMLALDFSKHEAISQLAGDPQLRHLHRQLIELQPVTREARISPSLAVGRAKLEISADLPELLRLLKPNEKAALLSDPESLARLEQMILPFIPPPPAAKPAETVAVHVGERI
ncbi:glucans biosynthesis glucosyltransferase MdoH [Rhodomicrobium vannielii]|nr:glucans biosynthesis glucosyltransferase MdoH [Rhodomicrobium vannielii]